MQYLDIEELLRLHYQLIEDYGGSHGVRDEGRLQSVIAAPAQKVFGEEQYKSVFEKAALYIGNIVADHPFVDGNKRTAVTTGGIFLLRNHRRLTVSAKELEDFVVHIAINHLDIPTIAAWLEAHSKAA
jgi:death on curing protein